ncbi:MAG: bifunctional diaminohydroxyphosphoribosylaminopyrimidine deaminase/5-amino-6-(5-phosphoribosylamino)uracil reductase RibD [Candidatus Omnitrophica bacterium]|nr:bifunctional diaminohydroxyphosphoribosylaminopyrimidine deaminase/5-amino-6-(5-phosphoribosylamino)uracil reductase RibD [Candidatus Omnitrophota bacterium]
MGTAESNQDDVRFMRLAIRLARRAYGYTSPNPLVGAVLVKNGKIIGQGWHHRAGEPHAEIEALRHAQASGFDSSGATLYATLEPCSTHGRTPPCTDAIQSAKIARFVGAATDPNPAHRGRGFDLLTKSGIEVSHGLLADEANRLNEAFNHWIVHRLPFVTVKSALTLDGKIATAGGESKWITGEKARASAMRLRMGADAILVGINTALSDDPRLTVRLGHPTKGAAAASFQSEAQVARPLVREKEIPRRRIVLDSAARIPLSAALISDPWASWTTMVTTQSAPPDRVDALSRRVNVWIAPVRDGKIDLRWLLKKLGEEKVTHLLVEGGGEINASFLFDGLVQRVAFFYAPKILGDHQARKGVAGRGARRLDEVINLHHLEWRILGADLMLTARVG